MAANPNRVAEAVALLQGQNTKPTVPSNRVAEARALLMSQMQGQNQAPAPTPVQQEKGPNLLQTLAKPFTTTAATAEAAIGGLKNLAGAGISSLLGNRDAVRDYMQRANEAAASEYDYGIFGSARPVTTGETGEELGRAESIKRIIGTGLELGSYAAPVGIGGEAIQAVKALPKAGTAIKAGIGYGMLGGGLASGGRELTNPNATVGSVLKETGIGSAFGGVVGGAFPAIGAAANIGGKGAKLAGEGFGAAKTATEEAASKLKGALNPESIAPEVVKAKNFTALNDVVKNNSTLRNIVQKNDRYGIDVQKIISDTDLIRNSVDASGTIDTLGKGKAVSILDSVIKPYTDVVRKLLEREGSSISPEIAFSSISKDLENSGIRGLDLQKALENVKREILAMSAKSVDGNIPLTAIHDLKVYKGKTLSKAFFNPAGNRVDTEIYSALRKLIEDNSSEEVRAINRELQQYQAVKELLKALHGKKVKGGRLGSYFSKLTGGVIGNSVGGIPGAFVGSGIASKIQELLLQSTFSGKTGEELIVNQILKDALERSAKPRLALPPASRAGGPIIESVGEAIPMRGPASFEPPASVVGNVNSQPSIPLAGSYSSNIKNAEEQARKEMEALIESLKEKRSGIKKDIFRLPKDGKKY